MGKASLIFLITLIVLYYGHFLYLIFMRQHYEKGHPLFKYLFYTKGELFRMIAIYALIFFLFYLGDLLDYF